MPFNNANIDRERNVPADSREMLEMLARSVVREPLSTHIIKTWTKSGKLRYLVVDRSFPPSNGCLALFATDGGFRVGRYHDADRVWGTVIWFLQEA
jgi:hypothetical protein